VEGVEAKDTQGMKPMAFSDHGGLVAMAWWLRPGGDGLIGPGYGLTGWAEGEATTAGRNTWCCAEVFCRMAGRLLT